MNTTKDIARFNASYTPEPNTGCWLWLGTIQRGYGHIHFAGKKRRAHRVSYELARGPIPDGLVLDHLCCEKSCVNPDHLEATTDAVNIQRAPNHSSKQLAARTHCKHGHAFTPENTCVKSDGARSCITCRRAQQKIGNTERMRKYVAANRDRRNAYQREYYARNAEKMAGLAREYRARKREEGI